MGLAQVLLQPLAERGGRDGPRHARQRLGDLVLGVEQIAEFVV
jgi:hypothetical protein